MTKEDYRQTAEKMREDAFLLNYEMSVLIEDYYDEPFWRYIIESIKPELRGKIDFPNPSPRGTRGKDILRNFKDYVDNQFIICIDSDCEYLYNKNIWYLKDYVFHTIVYTRENYQCHFSTLNEICKDLTFKSYDFELLFQEISKSIADIFFFWIYIHANSLHKLKRIISSETFEYLLDLSGTHFEDIGDEYKITNTIQERSKEVLEDLKANMGEEWYNYTLENELPEIKEQLFKEHNIDEHNIILYCNGHAVYNKFVLPFLKKLIEILKNQKIREEEEKLTNAPEKVLQQSLQRIKKIASQDLETKLIDSYKFLVTSVDDVSPLQLIKKKLLESLT